MIIKKWKIKEDRYLVIFEGETFGTKQYVIYIIKESEEIIKNIETTGTEKEAILIFNQIKKEKEGK